ncbi:class A beta-lactamase-related serine hydrolase [Pseudomonas songnenensis]|uniref:Class A beta-lactamase-related serine hydrolase n=1 Tax=Pseudomonas songnenensis TaxID=1176259 RepID=A0ABX9UR35_9PSED|nr:serine hydrolase domain-containing protein [Pseudomonas songnenensis]RMH95656.1 class A beta-lactamase-related serine hydrolase [Pseudomonas songnenensis]
MCFRVIRLLGLVVAGGLLLGLPAYFWIGDRQQVLRFLYPAQALLTAPSLSCSVGAPAWLASAANFSLRDNSSPSGQLAHVTPDGTLHECHYGWHSIPLLSSRVTKESRFRYASMTKALTADAVLRQVSTGRLSLDDHLLDLLLPDVAITDTRLQSVTIEHLLRHSAGFDRLRSTDPMVVRNRKPWCPYTAEPLTKVTLDFAPGERYAYSNLNYCLLAMVLERVSEQPFRQLIEREYGLQPRDIRFVDGPYRADEVSYDFRNSNFYGDDYWRYFDFQALSSSAGLSGSASALASLWATLRDQRGFSVEHAAAEEICEPNRLRGCYGHGVFSYRESGSTLTLHAQPGFLYGSPSVLLLDNHGGVTVWVGNGMRHKGSSTDSMTQFLYRELNAFYASRVPQ